MRASVYFAASRIIPSDPSAPSHSELKRTSVFTGSRILKTCCLYVSAFWRISSFDSAGRVDFLPVGSPIIPVKSPMRKITRWPSCWKCRIFRMTTAWPRWMSGAVGSKPTLIVSGFPRCSLARRSFFSMRSTVPFARNATWSSSSDMGANSTRRSHVLTRLSSRARARDLGGRAVREG